MADRVIERVALGDRAYDVVIVREGPEGLGKALRAVTAAGKVFVVTDSRVAPLWAAQAEDSLHASEFAVHRIVIPDGEAHKTRDTWWMLVDAMLGAGIDRRTPVVALGGGVVGDLAGFAAASVMRGVPFVQVPTTLLAMVDSSVGGKTGFNHAAGKNLVGAFHQPDLVYAPMDCLSTLDPRQVRAGLGEVVKTAIIGDPALFERLEGIAAGKESLEAALPEVVARCVRVKASVVAEDEREAGRRAVLNLGHTVAHGIEGAAGYGTWLHGEAVGIGLVAEARWAVRAGVCLDAGLPDRIAHVVSGLGLPTTIPDVDRGAMVRCMGVDKKSLGAMLRLPVPTSVGQVVLVDLPMVSVGELVPETP